MTKSFRGDAKHRTRNLEIPRCAIAHLRSGPSDHPGMTEETPCVVGKICSCSRPHPCPCLAGRRHSCGGRSMSDSGSGYSSGGAWRGGGADYQPHAFDPFSQPELFRGVLTRRVFAFLIDLVVLAIPVI